MTLSRCASTPWDLTPACRRRPRATGIVPRTRHPCSSEPTDFESLVTTSASLRARLTAALKRNQALTDENVRLCRQLAHALGADRQPLSRTPPRSQLRLLAYPPNGVHTPRSPAAGMLTAGSLQSASATSQLPPRATATGPDKRRAPTRRYGRRREPGRIADAARANGLICAVGRGRCPGCS